MHFATWTCNLTKRYLVDMQFFSECMLDMQLWNIKFQTCVLTSGHVGVVSCGHAYSFRTWSGNMWTCILLQDMQDKHASKVETCGLKSNAWRSSAWGRVLSISHAPPYRSGCSDDYLPCHVRKHVNHNIVMVNYNIVHLSTLQHCHVIEQLSITT